MKNNDVYQVDSNAEVTDKPVKGRQVFAVKDEPTGERFKDRVVAKGFFPKKGREFCADFDSGNDKRV